ncbi:MAG: hypothetical protein L3V56_00465 [Candidatus Magnetoovum sp. WYHC-5]|nr:hypothetical protein [Candidatus Magnetoovum sp. WYHC-5]
MGYTVYRGIRFNRTYSCKANVLFIANETTSFFRRYSFINQAGSSYKFSSVFIVLKRLLNEDSLYG